MRGEVERDSAESTRIRRLISLAINVTMNSLTHSISEIERNNSHT